MKTCPFCPGSTELEVKVLYEDRLWRILGTKAGSINNAVMVVTVRHIATPFEISAEEWTALHALLPKMKQFVDNIEKPQGYNLGWNIHEVGGQHVMHAHLHLLARYNDEPLAGKGIRHAFKQLANKRPDLKP